MNLTTKEFLAGFKTNKYGVSAKHLRTYEGIVFDSKTEMYRYIDLTLAVKSGDIRNLQLQPSFELQEGFDKNGKHYKPIQYKADFKYYDNRKGKWIVEDVKGHMTTDFKIKQKMFEFKYPELTLKVVN